MNEQEKYLIERLDRESGLSSIDEASGARNSHAEVVRALVQHGGFVVTGRESTPGAHKTWLDHPTAKRAERVQLVSAALTKAGHQHTTHGPTEQWPLDPHEHRGEGFHIEHISKSDEGAHLIVSHHRKSAAGQDYAHGLDT